MSRKWLALAIAGALALPLSACGSSDDEAATASTSTAPVNATLNGSGSTFAAPIYQQLGSELKGQGLTINYQPVGSGQGISDLTNKSTVFADQLYLKRPIVVFADSPNDPSYSRQMELLARSYPELEERDVILVTDTDPEARSEWRQKLRPRGFSLVIMDKDLRPVIRKPLPWDVREITHAIDKLPLRRQEMLERNPAGR